MNPDSQDFKKLRQLMALKRHEIPPPGYFNGFSREVCARIKAGEMGNTSGEGSWFQRFWAAVEARPIFAGAFGVAVCGVLIAGILNSEDAGVASGSGLATAQAQGPVPFANVVSPVALNAGNVPQSEMGTNGVNPLESLFNSQVTALPVSDTFRVSTGN